MGFVGVKVQLEVVVLVGVSVLAGGVLVGVGVSDGVKVKVGVSVGDGVEVPVEVSVSVGEEEVAVNDSVGVLVNVAVGVGQTAFVKVCDQTAEVVPTLYRLNVNEQPFTSMAPKPCEVPIFI
jgi:hypothetical protein